MKKIELKFLSGEIAFSWESETNTIKETVEKFLKENIGKIIGKINLSSLDLSGVSFYNSSFYNSRFYNSRFDNSRFYNSRFDNQTISNIKTSGNIKMFDYMKNDFWAKLLKLKNEIPAFKEKITNGEINGSAYEGVCACFVGTFANIKGCNYRKMEGVYPDSGSPTEQWFMLIKPGMNPENSEVVKLTMEWIEEFELYLK